MTEQPEQPALEPMAKYSIIIPAPGLKGDALAVGFVGTMAELRAAVSAINTVTDAKVTQTVEQEVPL